MSEFQRKGGVIHAVLSSGAAELFSDGPFYFQGRSGVQHGTRQAQIRFPSMMVSISQLLEESFRIAWDYLELTAELGDAAAASRFLSEGIEIIIRRGQRNRLVLSNRAIGAYQRYRISGAAVSNRGTRSSA